MKILHLFGNTKHNRKFITNFQEYNPEWKIKIWSKKHKLTPIRMAAWCIYEYGGLVIIDTRNVKVINKFEHLPTEFVENKTQVIVSRSESSPCIQILKHFTLSGGIDYNIMYSYKEKQRVLKSVIKTGIFKQKDIPTKVLPIDTSYWKYTIVPHTCIPKTAIFCHIYSSKSYSVTIPSIIAMFTLLCISVFLIYAILEKHTINEK